MALLRGRPHIGEKKRRHREHGWPNFTKTLETDPAPSLRLESARLKRCTPALERLLRRHRADHGQSAPARRRALLPSWWRRRISRTCSGTFATRDSVHRAAARINAEVNKPLLPDLMLLDIMLPDADGLQILARLRAHSKFARLPVIMMTGKAEVADVKAGLAAGADGYVSKPFKVSALMMAVNLVLGKG
jgi:CheY-like chemotaxis protein